MEEAFSSGPVFDVVGGGLQAVGPHPGGAAGGVFEGDEDLLAGEPLAVAGAVLHGDLDGDLGVQLVGLEHEKDVALFVHLHPCEDGGVVDERLIGAELLAGGGGGNDGVVGEEGRRGGEQAGEKQQGGQAAEVHGGQTGRPAAGGKTGGAGQGEWALLPTRWTRFGERHGLTRLASPSWAGFEAKGGLSAMPTIRSE